MNNPLAYTDPTGYISKKLKKLVVRVIASVADVMGCGGACTMAVNAYYGYKSGGPTGLAASFIPGSSNAIANAAIEAGKGCVVAAANGGNCGRGAGSALILDQGSNFGLPGHLIAGCLAAANQGGSCRRGAVSAFEGLAANHIAKGVTESLTGSARRQQDISRALGGGETYENTLVPVAVAAVAPETAALMGVWAFRVFRLAGVAQRMRALSDILTANEAADSGERTRGLPPDGVAPPAGEVTVGPASRPSERDKGGKSLWDSSGGEWRYSPEDKWHNPHWDYNPHNKPSSPWQNIPIDQLPPRK
jgi:hypothetical protein